MKKTLNTALNKIGKLPSLPLITATAVMLTALLLSCLSAIMIPIIILGIVTFYAGKILIAKNDIINDYANEDSHKDTIENLKILFAQSFNALFPDTIPKLLINEIKTDIYTQNKITFYRLFFPISVLQQIEFGTLENLKADLQENIDAYAMLARFNIPVYYSDKNNVIETTVRLYSISTTDSSVLMDLYIIEDNNSFCLYQESLQ